MKKNYMLFHNKEKYTEPVQFHSHDYYEIYFFADGNVKYYVENEDYELKKGDVLIIPPGKLHRPVIDQNLIYERYVLWIFNSFLRDNAGIHELIDDISSLVLEKNTRLISLDDAAFTYTCDLLNKTTPNGHTEDTSEFVSECRLALVLNELKQALKNMNQHTHVNNDLSRQLILYLNEHYLCNPSLDDLAKEFYVSKYYLSHKFKEHTKTTIHNYILMKKINLAKELLNSGISPQNVSSECGFSTYSNFYKAFVSQTGISPKKYRTE